MDEVVVFCLILKFYNYIIVLYVCFDMWKIIFILYFYFINLVGCNSIYFGIGCD